MEMRARDGPSGLPVSDEQGTDLSLPILADRRSVRIGDRHSAVRDEGYPAASGVTAIWSITGAYEDRWPCSL